MSNTISKLFGAKPKKPTVVKAQEPVEKVQAEQNEVERQQLIKEFAKKRRATLLSESGQASIGRKALGAGL